MVCWSAASCSSAARRVASNRSLALAAMALYEATSSSSCRILVASSGSICVAIESSRVVVVLVGSAGGALFGLWRLLKEVQERLAVRVAPY
jgi:hypothetical protein